MYFDSSKMNSGDFSQNHFVPHLLTWNYHHLPAFELARSERISPPWARIHMSVVESDGSVDVQGPFEGPRADLGRRARATDTIIIVGAVVAALYFGRDVLVPIALAILLSFVLAPVVEGFARLRTGKVAAVLLSVFLAFAVLGGLGAIIGRQVGQLADNLPQYQSVITEKLRTLRSSDFGAGLVGKASEALHGLSLNLTKPAPEAGSAAPTEAAAPRADREMVPVEVHEPQPGPIQILQSVLSALLPPLATAAIVVIFVIFILLQRDDLRDRFIGLIGAHDLHRTTKALDDAGKRLSRYFLALTAINAVFGIGISIGLTVIGVPNPVLWGIVGAVLRFVPYIGAIISAAFPLALAAAVDPGWSMAAETAALFVGLETIMSQVVEPQLFGHTTGMSPLAIIVAAAFWTLIWGPPGLLLSTPVTACLVVLGRHVESLNFIELLLGDKPALSSVQSFYQRILASDPDEVAFQAETLLKNFSLLDYYEDVALPALAMAQVDVDRQVMDLPRQIEVCASVEHVVADLSDHVDAEPETVTPIAISPPQPNSGGEEVLALENAPRAALCIGGRTPLDQAACAILVQLLERRGVAARAAKPQVLTNRGILELRAEGVDAICIFYLDHQSLAAVRYSVRRLRKRFPQTPIAVCLWGSVDLPTMKAAANADATVGSLHEAVDFCASPSETRA
jgi:predicted PurR-regulated permease PerM